MRKSLLLALGCLLLCSVAARADSLYLFNGTLETTSGNKTVTGQFTWNGNFVTSWDLDFSQLAGTCGWYCQLGGLQPFTTLGNGYEVIGNASDSNGSAAGDNSYLSYSGGVTNTILTVSGYNNNNTAYSTQLGFDFNSVPGSFNTLGGNNQWAAFISSGLQNDYMWAGGSATLATPEPASVVLGLTGGLMLLAGFFWQERRRHASGSQA
ncbi:MAG TPA: hypothetical protein VIE13_01765 [Terriglobales bacterium]|jgi:hypothetical protein